MNIVVQAGRIRKFIFDHADPIFKLTEPTLDKGMSNNCVVCEKDIHKKDRRYCDFCGSRVCEKCMHKKRRFLSHLDEVDELAASKAGQSANGSLRLAAKGSVSERVGQCCKICDRKFFMYQTFVMNRE